MAGPKVGNRASAEDVTSYYEDVKPGKKGFAEEALRRSERTPERTLSESRSRAGKGKIGVPAGQLPTKSPTKAPTPVAAKTPSTVPAVEQPATVGTTTAGRGAAWLKKENL